MTLNSSRKKNLSLVPPASSVSSPGKKTATVHRKSAPAGAHSWARRKARASARRKVANAHAFAKGGAKKAA